MIKYFLLFSILALPFGCREEKGVIDQPQVQNIPKDDYQVKVDKMPMPEGGIAAIQANVVYPPEAKKKGIEGKVVVKMDIDTEGNVKSAETITPVNPLLDKAALDAVRKVKFSPGYKDGKAVNTQIAIPIVFKLGDKKSNAKEFSREGEFYSEASKMPEYLGGIDIVYPKEEKNAGTQGQVVLKIYLDEKGTIKKAEVIKGVTPGLDKAALDAVKKAKFTPGVIDGKNVKTVVTLPISFKLK